MAIRPEQNTEESIQYRLEQQIREACELHGWATAVSVANPVDILIMIEEHDKGDELELNEIWSTNTCHK